MTRINYTDGRPFTASDWNIFANLSNKEKIIYNNIASKLSLADTTEPDTDTKTNTDALTTAPAQLDVLLTDMNTKIDSLGELALDFAVNNALNITETETLSWYDSSLQVGNKLLYLNNEQRIIDNTYIEPSEIVNQTLNITDINKNYVLNGEIRYADLTKSYSTQPNLHAEYSLPSGTMTQSTPLIERNSNNFDVSFDTDENWDDINIDVQGSKSVFDGINVINYTYAFIELEDNDPSDLEDSSLVHMWMSVLVDVYLPDGSLVSSNQYNAEIEDSNTELFQEGIDFADSGSRSFGYDFEIASTIDQTNKFIMQVITSVELETDFRYDSSSQRFLFHYVKAYSTSMVVSKTGLDSSTKSQIRDFGFLGNGTYVFNIDTSFSTSISQPRIAQSSDGVLITGGVRFELEAIREDAQGDIIASDIVAASYVAGITSNSLGVITRFEDEIKFTNADHENPDASLVINPAVDNNSTKIYAYAQIQADEVRDIFGDDYETRTENILWEIGLNGITTLGNNSIKDEDILYKEYELKLSPNYDTNLSEIHYRYRWRDSNKIYRYVYNTTEKEFLSATNTSVLVKDGRISDGVDWYGVEYTYNRQEDTPDFIRMNRQNKYASIEHNGIKETGTDNGKSSQNTFKLYHSLPVGTSIDIIPNN